MTGIINFFTPAFFSRFAAQPLARTIKFLLIFILIISAVIALNDALMIGPRLKYVQKWAEDNLKKIPAIEVKDGVLIRPQESFMLEMGNEFSVFALELDRQKQADILAKYKNVVMLTRNQFVFQQTSGDSLTDVRRRDYDKAKNWKILPNEAGFTLEFDNNRIFFTPENVKKWLKVVSVFLFPSFLLILFVIYSFTKLLQILFFSLAGLMANAVLKAEASYKQVFNICSYALVPPTAFVILLEVFRLRLPGSWFLFSAVYLLYIFLGLQAAKTKEKASSDETG
jgi:hypothetical protein